MDPVANPFRPGAGRRPPLLAGRGSVLEAFDVLRRRAEELGEGDRSWVLHGLRGVGKTVLLNELLVQVGSRGWITAKLEATAGTPLSVALTSELLRSLRTATGRHPAPRLRRLLGMFKAFSLKVDPASGAFSVDVDIAPIPGADSGRFAEDLAALFTVLGETSRELGIGTLILVDELQEASAADLTAINTAVHAIGQGEQPLPVVFVGAGLPSLPAQLAEATSYAERLYEYRAIGLLDGTDAQAALTGPTSLRGVDWDPAALRMALDVAAGYPYFLQAVGKHVWDVSPGPRIHADDVVLGGEFARREVDDGLYRSRWERATVAQRALLRAMAELAGERPVAVADLVGPLNRNRVQDLSVARTELIKKGLLYAPERGLLAFTVPGMSSFIMKQGA